MCQKNIQRDTHLQHYEIAECLIVSHRTKKYTQYTQRVFVHRKYLDELGSFIDILNMTNHTRLMISTKGDESFTVDSGCFCST